MTIKSTVGRGGHRPGAGRPKIDPKDRVKLFGLYLTDERRGRYQDAAGAEGEDLQDWIRRHLDAAAEKALGRK